jgi:hypothetical protein
VHGQYTVAQGLSLLLKGAGLGFSVNDTVVVIKAARPERDPPRRTAVIAPPQTGIEQASGESTRTSSVSPSATKTTSWPRISPPFPT